MYLYVELFILFFRIMGFNHMLLFKYNKKFSFARNSFVSLTNIVSDRPSRIVNLLDDE